jgi:DNA-binding CsgD family transcriptional regulator
VSSDVIQVERARRVVEVLGEAREIGLGSEAARRHIGARVLDVVGAACCILAHDGAHKPDGRGRVGAKTGVNLSPEVAGICEVLEQRGCAMNLVHLTLMQNEPRPAPGYIATATDAVVARRAWERSELFDGYFRPAHVDRYLASVHHAGECNDQGFAVFRAAGDAPFTEEDRQVMHLLHLGLGPLFAIDPARVALAPRVRETLDVLLTGAPDKEIAEKLRISPHTARQYVKTILKAYGVSSRAQLIARLAG